MRIIGGYIFLALGFAAPANADWQYTKWGMTPEQVVAASSGDVQLETDGKGCTGTYRAGKFRFFVTFKFGDNTHRLEEVTLLLHPERTVQELSQAMQEKYGPWTEGLVWIDKNDGYSVEFEPSFGTAFVRYRPLHEAEKGGL